MGDRRDTEKLHVRTASTHVFTSIGFQQLNTQVTSACG